MARRWTLLGERDGARGENMDLDLDLDLRSEGAEARAAAPRG